MQDQVHEDLHQRNTQRDNAYCADDEQCFHRRPPTFIEKVEFKANAS